MKRKFVLFFVVSCFFLPGRMHAQGIKALRINEILVYNDSDSGYQDNYGVRSGWFEIYNSGVKTLNLGGCYITNDPENPIKYRIPKSAQNATLIPNAYAVVFAYNKPLRSPFHVNFNLTDTLLSGGRAYLAIYDQSGKELIDSVSYVLSEQKSNVSIGKKEDETNPKLEPMDPPTPLAINSNSSDKSRAEIYSEKDRHGFIITITCMGVVFLLLLVIAIVFKCTGAYFKRHGNEKYKRIGKFAGIKNFYMKNADDEIAAVIAATLYLYRSDCHEIEDDGFYLNRTFNQPSPWANKLLNFRRTPIRK